MKAQKDKATGTWKIQYRYRDFTGEYRKSTKRGFSKKIEAEEWLRNFLLVQQADLNMRFEDFVGLYYQDMENRIRESTMRTKRYIVDLKIMPYFKAHKMNGIKPVHIRKWQNEMMQQGYSQTYLKTIQNQLSAIMNYAVTVHDLRSNPCKKAGGMGRGKADEMLFWEKSEFNRFADSIMNKRQAYMAFMVLYWTGMRVGELLALTPKDIDIEKRTITISKSYQRLGQKDVITEPKTSQGRRVVSISDFLADELSEYMKCLYNLQDEPRIFPFTKSFLSHEMERGTKLSGVKRIRIHDLRHSHVAHLIELGFSLLEIGARLGHTRIETTMVYAHLYPNKQEKIASKLSEEYREAMLCQD